MARESFLNANTAAVMNEHFINIKVDRDERPDLDKVYQSALQLIAPKSGGWPLTLFLEPDFDRILIVDFIVSIRGRCVVVLGKRQRISNKRNNN